MKRLVILLAFSICLCICVVVGCQMYRLGIEFQHDARQYDLGEKLISAAIVGNNKEVRILVRQGANLEFSDNATALEAAIQNGYPDTVKLLVGLGAKVDYGRDGLGTPLMEANDAAIAAYLLDHGSRVNARDEAGMTPLMNAAIKNNDQVVRLLIQRGADLNARSTDGKTALSWALESARGNRSAYQETIQALRHPGAVASQKQKKPAPESMSPRPTFIWLGK